MQLHDIGEGISLLCLDCGAALSRQPSSCRCLVCGAEYPIHGGVLRMLGTVSDSECQTRVAFDYEHRQFERAEYLHITPKLIDDWLLDVDLPKEFFAERTVLDMGCGSGRWTYAMAMLGARVVAVDFTDAAVDITREVTRHLPKVTVIQANLFRLPFTTAQFDFVVSWGVLHHTTSTRAAFKTLVPLVRPGGMLHIMVYERRSPIKVAGTELLRAVLRRLPAELRYRLCGYLVIKNRMLFQLLRGLIACVPIHLLREGFDIRSAQFGLYDWYSPRFNHLHSIGEVRAWFAEAGFDQVRVTTPIKYTRSIDIFRFGECGGSISIQGSRRAKAPQLSAAAELTGCLRDTT